MAAGVAHCTSARSAAALTPFVRSGVLRQRAEVHGTGVHHAGGPEVGHTALPALFACCASPSRAPTCRYGAGMACGIIGLFVAKRLIRSIPVVGLLIKPVIGKSPVHPALPRPCPCPLTPDDGCMTRGSWTLRLQAGPSLGRRGAMLGAASLLCHMRGECLCGRKHSAQPHPCAHCKHRHVMACTCAGAALTALRLTPSSSPTAMPQTTSRTVPFPQTAASNLVEIHP
jgi:hypothetical protein